MRRLALVLLVLALPSAAAAEPNGRQLFVEGCASCHGLSARGVPGVGPDLHGAGAAAADFYLSTGRMPLDVATGEQPLRSQPAYPPAEIRALVHYIGSLGGPQIPKVHPERGDLSTGQHAYTVYCAGCHQIVGAGRGRPGRGAAALDESTPTQIAEAVRIGPYLMPRFTENEIDEKHAGLDRALRAEVAQDPPDDGRLGHRSHRPDPGGDGRVAARRRRAVARRAADRGAR